MLHSGLVSISMRSLMPKEIITAVANAQLDGIEWGGDVHVPVGDYKTATHVREMTEEAGLKTYAYGSYFRAGCSIDAADAFVKVLNSARKLNAPIIRIWASNKGSAEISNDDLKRLIADTRVAADMAGHYGITISFECHNNTYTDDYHASLKLLEMVCCDNVKLYYQPNQYKSFQYNLDAAFALAPHVTNVHTFHWDGESRYPLSQGIDCWRQYVDIFRSTGNEHAFLLEFMHDDAPDTLYETAQTLRSLLFL